MNSGFRPISPTMPIDQAADMMVRRGECQNFFAAKAKVLRQRNGACLGRIAVTPETRQNVRRSFGIEVAPARPRQYHDDTLD